MTDRTHQAAGSDLREFLRPVWRYRWLIVFVVAATTVAVYVYNDGKPDRFSASTQIFLQASEVDQSLFGPGASIQGDRNIINQANLLQTPAVAQDVAEKIGFQGHPSALLGAISVGPSKGSDFLVVSGVSDTAAGAAQLANAFAEAFIDLRAATSRSEIQRALTAARRQLASLPITASNATARSTLRTRISSLEAIQSLSPGGARQIDKAVPAVAPFEPQPRRAAVFGFMLSLALALLGAYGLERLDRRVKHLDEVGTAYGAPVLAALPHLRGSMFTRNGAAPEIAPSFREAVRGLRTNLQLASPDEPLRTILITSALPGEGKSTLAINLAIAFAEAGQQVAVIECDLRLPAFAKLIAVRPSPGLSDVLTGKSALTAAIQTIGVGERANRPVSVAAANGPTSSWTHEPVELMVLTAGAQPSDPSSLLATPNMKQILDTAQANNDVVILDTPPLLSVADALPLLRWVDATVVVARIGMTNRAASRRLREIIERVPGASLTGAVANDVNDSDTSGEYYGYGYGATYGRNLDAST